MTPGNADCRARSAVRSTGRALRRVGGRDGAHSGQLDLVFLGGSRLLRSQLTVGQQAKARSFERFSDNLGARLDRRRIDGAYADFAGNWQLSARLSGLQVGDDFGARLGSDEVFLLKAKRIDVVRTDRRANDDRSECKGALDERAGNGGAERVQGESFLREGD